MNKLHLLILTITLLLSNISTQAQFQASTFVHGNYYWQDSSFSITSGFALNAWVHENVALNYDLRIGYDSDYSFAISTGWGQLIGGAILLSKTDSTENFRGLWITLGILALIVPKGLTFAINPYDEVVLMPYINPLEVRILGNNGGLNYGGDIGLKVHFELDNGMAIRPNVGIRYLYSKGRVGASFGIEVMFAGD